MLEGIQNLFAAIPATYLHAAGTWLAAILTLLVLSYIVGYMPLYRLAGHLFIGVSAGYAAGLAWHTVLWPRLVLLISDPSQHWIYGVFFALGLLLLMRGIGPLSGLADLPMALLFGIGAALALVGAAMGTLVPQVGVAIASLAPASYGGGAAGWALAIDAALLLIGTLLVFASFHHTQATEDRPAPGLRLLSRAGIVGREILLIAIGALFSGALISFYTVLAGRIQFLISDWGAAITGMRF